MTANKGQMKRKVYDTFLECTHKLYFLAPPMPGESVWCVKCQDYKRAMQKPNTQLVKCSDCKYSRTYGNRSNEADAAAVRHKNKYHSHTVVVWENDKIVHSYIGPLQAQLPIDMADQIDQEIPF